MSAHLLGRTSPGCEAPLERTPELMGRIDSEVARRLYELELFAEPSVLDAARAVRETLMTFRDVVSADVDYMGDLYRSALGPYQEARRQFLGAARQELLA